MILKDKTAFIDLVLSLLILKKVNMKTKSVILAMLLLGVIALSSCENENENVYEDVQAIDKKEIKDQDT
jgi:predicted small secreted protein